MKLRDQVTPFPTRFVFIALVAGLLATLAPTVAHAQPAPVDTPPMDYAALLLQPADLEAEGIRGMWVDSGQAIMTVDELMDAEALVQSRGWMQISALPDAGTILHVTGWQQLQELELATPDPNDPGYDAFQVTSGVEEYATPDGAAAAFVAFSDERGFEHTLTGLTTMMPIAAPPGDASVMFRTIDTVESSPANTVTTMVLTGNRIVSVTLTDFTAQRVPEGSQVERLAAVLLDRIETADEGGARSAACLPDTAPSGGTPGARLPGMSFCAQRLTGPSVTPLLARYNVLDGVAIPLMRDADTEGATAEVQAEVDAIGLVDTYQLAYAIDDHGWSIIYEVQITSYTDEAAASARFDNLEWMASSSDRPITSWESQTAPVGDRSATWVELDDNGMYYTGSAVRIDQVVVSTRVILTDLPVPAMTDALLISQVRCMQAGGCFTPLPMSPELIEAAEATT